MSEVSVSADGAELVAEDQLEERGGSQPDRGGAGAWRGGVLRWLTRSRVLSVVAVACGCVALFALYWRQAQTNAFSGDAGSNVLQAWDMLHGNVLLRGWYLTDVSFYLTELPQYGLIECVRGVSTGVMYIAAAMTYTLAVVMAAWLAKGRTRGREAAPRVLIVLVIMLAPALGEGTILTLSWPDHLGTAVALLVIFLLFERMPSRWYRPVVLMALLVWVEVSDSSALVTGSATVAVVAGLRWWRSGDRSEAVIGIAAVVAAGVSVELVGFIRSAGGFLVWSPNTDFVQSTAMSGNLWASVEGYLQLFGADFFGLPMTTSSASGVQHPSGGTTVALLHLSGAVLVAWAAARGVRRLAREDDGTVQLLTVGIVLNVAAVVSTTLATNGGAREMVAVLPFGAALAGRTLGARVVDRRVVACLSGLVVIFSAVLVNHATRPAVPAQSHPAEAWLTRHGYRYGLGEYFSASGITVDSGGAVAVRPICTGSGVFAACRWDADAGWYDPARYSANFLVLDADDSPSTVAQLTANAVRQFGSPAQTITVSGQRILIWRHNVLQELVRTP